MPVNPINTLEEEHIPLGRARENNATRMHANGSTPCQLHMRLQGLIFIKATRDNILAAKACGPRDLVGFESC